jgi:arginine deiminase
MSLGKVFSETGTLRSVLVYEASFNMWELKLPFSGEHQLSWYTTKNASYEKGKAQYFAFLKHLRESHARVYDISKIIQKIVANATEAERKEIIKRVWQNHKRRPSPSKLSHLHILRGYPPFPTFNGQNVTTPDFVRANIYSRDIGFATQLGLVISRMRGYSRREQPRILHLVTEYDKELSKRIELFWVADCDEKMIDFGGAIEGGDIQVLRNDTLSCGIGLQTNFLGFAQLAEKLLTTKNSPVRRVIGVRLPKNPMSAFMHLDTTITFYDHDGAIVMPYIYESWLVKSLPKRKILLKLIEAMRADLYRDRRSLDSSPSISALDGTGECIVLEKKGSSITKISFRSYIDFLVTEKLLDPDKVVMVGGDPGSKNRDGDIQHLFRALHEQYTQAPNVVCLRPKVVIAYPQNKSTNDSLRKMGVTIKDVPSTYMDMGGGPHCMTMPLSRE